MTTTVTPETFTYVSFDSAGIRTIADRLLDSLGMGSHDLSIVVDETTPLARVTVDIADDVITISAESGAFEDTRRPREQNETAVATAIGRALLRVRDRLEGGFAEAPADEDLSLAQIAAWDTYCVGRLERLGVTANQQRWRYNFRNRHGFSDRSDAGFDRLWASDGITWDELDETSRSAAHSNTAVTG